MFRSKFQEYSHAQAYDNNVPPDAVVTLHPPVRTWYPNDPSRVLALLVFYFIALACNVTYFIGYTIKVHPDGPIIYGTDKPAAFGWHFILFSYWVGIIQILFFIVAIIDLLLRDKDISERFHAHKDRFYDVVFALTLLICVSYWFTIFPNRLSDTKDIIRRLAEDLCAYGFTTVVVAIETLVISHRYATRTRHMFR